MAEHHVTPVTPSTTANHLRLHRCQICIGQKTSNETLSMISHDMMPGNSSMGTPPTTNLF